MLPIAFDHTSEASHHLLSELKSVCRDDLSRILHTAWLPDWAWNDSSEKTWNRQRIERIKLILFHCYPLHLLNPLMGFDLFSVES